MWEVYCVGSLFRFENNIFLAKRHTESAPKSIAQLAQCLGNIVRTAIRMPEALKVADGSECSKSSKIPYFPPGRATRKCFQFQPIVFEMFEN